MMQILCDVGFVLNTSTVASTVLYCVLAQVSKGMEVVKATEAVGSSSGKTSSPVIIADCGQLA